jgi:hypothetical protein
MPASLPVFGSLSEERSSFSPMACSTMLRAFIRPGDGPAMAVKSIHSNIFPTSPRPLNYLQTIHPETPNP